MKRLLQNSPRLLLFNKHKTLQSQNHVRVVTTQGGKLQGITRVCNLSRTS